MDNRRKIAGDCPQFASLTMASMVIGYILGIISIPRYISQSRALAVSAVLGTVFSIVAIITSGYLSVIFIALLGLQMQLCGLQYGP
jgi:fucose permease